MITVPKGPPGNRYAGPQTAKQARASRRALARGSIALVVNSGLTALFGVLFWLVAAHVLNAAVVGRGSALVSALMTVSGLCQLNYARSLSGLLPSAARPRKLLGRVYGLTTSLSLTVGLATAVILPYATTGFSYLRDNRAFIMVFAASVGLWTVFTLEDSALTSIRRAAIIPFENGIYGILKLVCLIGLSWAGYRTSMAVFISWIMPLVAIIIPLNLFLFLRALRRLKPAPISRESRASPWQYYDLAGYLLWLTGTLPLPVLVLMRAGAASAASFYIAYTIASAIDLLSLMLGNSLTSELSRTGGAMTVTARSYVQKVWLTIGVLSLSICILAPLVLQVFGASYRAEGTLVLRIFMIATLPRSILFLGIAVQRSRGEGLQILLLQAISALGTLALGFALTHPLGAAGMATGWLLASCLAALVSAVFLAHTAVKGRHRRERLKTRTKYEAHIPKSGARPTRGSYAHLNQVASGEWQ